MIKEIAKKIKWIKNRKFQQEKESIQKNLIGILQIINAIFEFKIVSGVSNNRLDIN